MNDALTMTSAPVCIYLDNAIVQCEAGATVASVLLANDVYAFSTHPVDHSPRGAFCMMGACQACRVLIDERWQQACQCVVSDGMRVRLCEDARSSASGNDDARESSASSDAVRSVTPHSDTSQLDTDRQSDE